MQKLTDRQIIRIHQMASAGISNQDIACELEVHRNTIYRHLSLRFPYSAYVMRVLCLDRPMPTERVMTIYAAAAYLPGWPSDAVVFRLYRAGVLEAKKTTINGRAGVLGVRMPAVRRAARKMLPQGLWLKTETLPLYCEDAARLICETRHLAIDCKYWPATHYKYLPAPSVFGTAAELEIPIKVPLRCRKRASLCLEATGVATL